MDLLQFIDFKEEAAEHLRPILERYGVDWAAVVGSGRSTRVSAARGACSYYMIIKLGMWHRQAAEVIKKDRSTATTGMHEVAAYMKASKYTASKLETLFQHMKENYDQHIHIQSTQR